MKRRYRGAWCGKASADRYPLPNRVQEALDSMPRFGSESARAFDGMPLLADALEEVGCDDSGLINHCRSPRPHVLGCWALDALLGRVGGELPRA